MKVASVAATKEDCCWSGHYNLKYDHVWCIRVILQQLITYLVVAMQLIEFEYTRRHT